MSASERERDGDPMAGIGGVRRLAARWVITGDLRLVSACHLGGEATDSLDMPVQRDRVSGGRCSPALRWPARYATI